MSWRNSTVVSIFAIALSTTLFAGMPHEIQRRQLKSERDATPVPSGAIRSNVESTAKGSPVGIAKVRLDPAPPGKKENAAVLKFQMSNGSSSTLADIVFEVSIVEERRRGQVDTPKRVLAGPFTIRETTVIRPGYTVDYEILLRSLSVMCRCAANIRVLSFRSIEDSDPHTSCLCPAYVREECGQDTCILHERQWVVNVTRPIRRNTGRNSSRAHA